MSNKQLYQQFYELFTKAHPNLSKQTCQTEANEKWHSFKVRGSKVLIDKDLYNNEILRLKSKISKKQSDMFQFLLKKPAKNIAVATSTSSRIENATTENVELAGHNANDKVPTEEVSNTSGDNEDQDNIITDNLSENECGEEEQSSDNVVERVYDKPAQTKLKNELIQINERLVALNEARNLGLGEENVASLTKQINEMSANKRKLEVKLKNLKSRQKSSKKVRVKKKTQLSKIIEEFPTLATKIRMSTSSNGGRPPLEETYPSLHRDILDIATIGAGASDRRRSEIFRSVKNLKDLHSTLSDLGYKISKSALYYRLQPSNAGTNDGKRHVHTVPVR